MMILMTLLLALDELPRDLNDDVIEDQEEQDPEPLRPPTLGAPERPFRPRYPRDSAFRLSALILQPSVSYDTREYFPGNFSGDVDLNRRADLPRVAPGFAFSLELGPVRVDGGFVHMATRPVLDRELKYEEETFQPGEEVSVLAQAGWLDVAWRLKLAGGDRGSISALLGVHAPRVKIDVENDRASAREGFNALWPVPALGVEANYWLTDRIRIHGALTGTRLRFSNPFHEDGGEPQRVAYTYLRVEAGVTADLSANWGLSVGYTSFSMDVTASSRLDDKDRAVFEAGGLYLALEARF